MGSVVVSTRLRGDFSVCLVKIRVSGRWKGKWQADYVRRRGEGTGGGNWIYTKWSGGFHRVIFKVTDENVDGGY